MRNRLVLAFVGLSLLAAGCTSSADEPQADDPTRRSQAASPPDQGHGDQGHGDQGHGDQGHGNQGHGNQGHGNQGHGNQHPGPAPEPVPLRAGERFVELTMPEPYTPSAPYGTGTDDYRCFVLDPGLEKSAFVTGVNVLPGHADVVHHVILFRVPPSDVAEAEAQDASEDGQGWTCFGGTGLASDVGGHLDAAPWIGAWAPGGGESVMSPDIGIPLQPGSRIIMQVHYNLLVGDAPDMSSAKLRLAAGDADLASLETMLMPAPVELPCRPGHDDGPLCDRQAAVADVIERFGAGAGWTVSGLHLLCGGDTAAPRAGAVQHCDRQVTAPMTVRAVAGHMHLLGREISIELNPGERGARTLLDIPMWNFDDQSAIPLRKPTVVEPGDTLRVTCRHTQQLRDLLPEFEGQPDRYIVWGDGTNDEMCLGILLVTRP